MGESERLWFPQFELVSATATVRNFRTVAETSSVSNTGAEFRTGAGNHSGTGASSTTSAGWSAPILAKHPPLQLKYFYILFMGDKIRFKPIFNDVKIKEKKIEFKTTYGVAAGSGGGWAGAAAGSGSWAVAGSAGGGWAGRRGPCGEAVAVRGAVGEGRATLTELRWPVQLRRRRSDGGEGSVTEDVTPTRELSRLLRKSSIGEVVGASRGVRVAKSEILWLPCTPESEHAPRVSRETRLLPQLLYHQKSGPTITHIEHM
nr:hypothetical protein Iba_chr11bCG15030 [Ipomoea batatas]